MITYEDALKIVLDNAPHSGTRRISFSGSAGRVLAEDVFSDINMPPFNRSAVDGFACRMDELGLELEVIETIRAGTFPVKKVETGQCTGIMTGAPVPEGADCVVMVEETEEVAPGRIRFTGVKTKTNISPFAEDIREGDRVLQAGIMLRPQHIAILAAAGHVHPLVAEKPTLAVISTGDEIVEPERKPGISQIRNSNGSQLTAQAVRAGANAAYMGIAPDNEKATLQMIEKALEQSDVVLLTGGVSLGTYDFVPAVMEKAGIGILFRTIALQPGKPTIFGTTGEKRVFGLPGNPVSSFTLFEILVKPMLWKMMGMTEPVCNMTLPLGVDYERRRKDRMQWLPVKITDGIVFPLEYHGSAHIFSLANANALASIPLGTTRLNKNAPVDVRPI